MKIQTLGDIHGESNWEDLIDMSCDKIIFIGDYVDSFHYSDEEIYDNLLNIINLKKSNPDKIILLIGNHDVQYQFYPRFGCSGFRQSAQASLTNLFNVNKNLFQASYQINDWFWSHAGVSQKYFDSFNIDLDLYENLSEFINELYEKINDKFFQVGDLRGGYMPWGGPIWADKRELLKHPFKNLNQIIGHTHTDKIEIHDHDDHKLYFIDVLQSDNPESLILNI